MLKKGKSKQDKKVQYLHKDSSFNIRDLVMRTPTSSSSKKPADLLNEQKQTKPIKQDVISKASPAAILKKENDKLADIIHELGSFDVSTIQRRSDPRMKVLVGQINDIIAKIFDRNSDEYDEYVIYSLDTLPITIGGSWHPLPEVQEGYRKGIQLAISKLTSLLAIQTKKCDAVATEKPTRRVVNEPSLNQIVTGKEKISLVNLRGKIKSRETVLFSQTEPTKGSNQISNPHNAGNDFSISTEKKLSLNNDFKLHQTKNIIDIDRKSIQGKSDDSDIRLSENLEEKLKKLEKTHVIKDAQSTSGEQKRNTLFEGSDRENDSLSSLVAKLNEIVTNEPEYTETGNNTPNNEKVLSLLENESLVIDSKSVDASFVEVIGLESSELDENEEVLVIDGDNILSSESNFIETLECGDIKQETGKLAEKDLYTDNIAGGKKRISLEELERRLREFDGEEIAEKDSQTDFEKDNSEEVLLIEDSNDIPEEMLEEIDLKTCSAQASKAQPSEQSVLDINGCTNPDKQLYEIADQDSPQDTINKEEMLMIECDSGLPEDVLDELQPKQTNLDKEKEQFNELETTNTVGLNSFAGSQQSDTNTAMIIDLISCAAQFTGRDENTIKEVILEDLEERMRDFIPFEPEQEYLIYIAEEKEAQTEEAISEERTDESAMTESGLRAMDDIQNSLGSYNAAEALSAIHCNEEIRLAEPVLKADIYESPKDAISEESSVQVLEGSHLPAGWDELYCQEVVNELAENGLCIEEDKELLGLTIPGEDAYKTCSDQILIKDIDGLPDYNFDTHLSAPVNLYCFEPRLEATNEDKDSERSLVESSEFAPESLTDLEEESFGDIYISLPDDTSEKTASFIKGDEPTSQIIEELREISVEVPVKLSEQTTCISEYVSDDQELLSINERIKLIDEELESCIEETFLTEINKMQEPVLPKPDINEKAAGVVSEVLDYQVSILGSAENLATEPLMTGNCDEISQYIENEELISTKRTELSFFDEVCNLTVQDSLQYNPVFELEDESEPADALKNVPGIDEPLPSEVFENHLKESEGIADLEHGVKESRSRDTILLEALEEMLSNLEMNTPEQDQIRPEPIIAQFTPPPNDDKIPVIESQNEPPQRAVLIKTTEERSNPFAMAGIGKEKTQAKTLCSDDLQKQIGELKYRIDDLKTFDIDSIDQRFDPRVRALGDTVNNTLADIFGRNTPLYWQHALPSLDSLPVVVGGPKLSPEELRGAYRRRINDAISKVNITIDILEAKLEKVENKRAQKKSPEPIIAQFTPPPNDDKIPVIESQNEPPQRAVLIKTTEERSNPFAMAGIGKEKTQAKTLCSDDLQKQIGELKYRIDDLKTFDIDSIDQRFDPRVRALGDTVNNTLADIFGRNTPLYWQHALPSLDSLPVVVGGPKLSPEELRGAYRRRINDAISKVNITIDILEAKLEKVENKGSSGHVLYFSPKTHKYNDIQSLR